MAGIDNFAAMLNSMSGDGAGRMGELFSHLTPAGSNAYAQFCNQATPGQSNALAAWFSVSTTEQVKHAADWLNSGKYREPSAFLAWLGVSAEDRPPASETSHNLSYHCGKCGRDLTIAAPGPDTKAEELERHALYCTACDDLFCMGCGMQRMGEGGSVPCGNCGGPARVVDQGHRPSWFPGTRPGDRNAATVAITPNPGFGGDVDHYRLIRREGERGAEIIRELARQGKTGKAMLLVVIQAGAGLGLWKDYQAPESPLNLQGADLSNCAFIHFGSRFKGADLRGANLSNTFWFGGQFTKTNFAKATLQSSEMLGVGLDGADFSEANLTRVSWNYDARDEGVDFRRANLESASLRCDRPNGRFEGARMKNCQFGPERIDSSLDTSFLSGLSEEQRAEIAPLTKSKCFIATAAYGSPYQPEVLQLQMFRDQSLRRTAFGRCVIKVYEALSPPLAAWISRRAWAQLLTRQLLIRPAAFCARCWMSSGTRVPNTLVAHDCLRDSPPEIASSYQMSSEGKCRSI